MKKLILAAAVAGFLFTALAAADEGEHGHKGKHPNLRAAHELVVKAIGRIDAAQKANEDDLGGHAAKAKDLLTQAEAELKQAAGAANEHDKDEHDEDNDKGGN